MVMDGVDEMRKAVREELRKGATQIKLFVSGGVVSPTDPIWMPQFSAEEIRAAVEEAATRRTYVMAHCHTDERARTCVEQGTRSIEHGTEIRPATAKIIAESGTYVVPTMSVAAVVCNHGPTQRYARTEVRRPVVQGEIGYEKLGEAHFEDFQRAAYWLSMLNGAAGHTYGAAGIMECYTAEAPFHRLRWSFMNWDESMRLPGSYQVGINSKLLRQYRWWVFEPRPDWILPRGTTLLEPVERYDGWTLGAPKRAVPTNHDPVPADDYAYPGGPWAAQRGTTRLPYAAGIPGEVRMIYIPGAGLAPSAAPTIFGLESGARYRAFFWEPSFGIRIHLGIVERPAEGEIVFADALSGAPSVAGRRLSAGILGESFVSDTELADAVVSVRVDGALFPVAAEEVS